MKKVRKAWNGGSKEAVMEEAAKMKEREIAAKQRFKAHKVMTPEEYARMPIVGWHEVCRDFDGFGGIGVRFLGDLQGRLDRPSMDPPKDVSAGQIDRLREVLIEISEMTAYSAPHVSNLAKRSAGEPHG